jgi:hypothetical protein
MAPCRHQRRHYVVLARPLYLKDRLRAENRLASAFEEFILPYDALRDELCCQRR